MSSDHLKAIEKPLRFVEFLKALAKINSKITRDIDEYRKVLWVHQIPREPKHCFARAWGEEDESTGDIWIEVRKFPEPPLPRVPDKCRDWLDRESLRNMKEIPELHQTIMVEREELDSETGETYKETVRLVLPDFPDIEETWNVYLEERWLPWTELYTRHLAVQEVYANLFHMYQEQQKLGEQFELVACIGLLTWKTPSGHPTRRHLVTARASLEFEPHLGKFTVRPTSDGEQMDIELDMLDVTDHPQNARQLVDDGGGALNGKLWDRSAVDPVLNAIANSLADSGQGEYYRDRIIPEADISEKPVVEYAPALILRKRSMRGLELLLEKMKEQIEEGVVIPREFLDLCESLDGCEDIEPGLTEEGGHDGEREIYFPLLSNEEQRRIIRTIDRQNGVLVQGPPGTGKSHTIANLICHFLATGKRVLVTAKTHRALQVLHEKLPDEIKPLCINLLGSSTEERESLERSVAGILTNLDRRAEIHSALRILKLDKDIQVNRAAKAESDNKLRALRESETYRHTVADGAYSGTAAEIARVIKDAETAFFWFQDQIPADMAVVLTTEEISRLTTSLVELTPEEESQYSQFIPDPEADLPKGELIKALFQRENAARELIATKIERLNTPEGRLLSQLEKGTIEILIKDLESLGVATKSALKRPMPWIAGAVYDVLNDKDMPWEELLRLSKSHSSGLQDSAESVDTLEVSIPDGMDRKKLLHDAKALKSHFEAGGGKGFWLLKPKTVREHGTSVYSVKVNGRVCKEIETLQELIDYLKVEQELEYIWSLWHGKMQRKNGPFPIQVAEIEELHETLEKVILLRELKGKASGNFSNLDGLRCPPLEDLASVYDLMETCRAALAQIDLSQIGKWIDKLQSNFSALAVRKNAHPVVGEIFQAFRNRDIAAYRELINQIRDLRRNSDSVAQKRQIIKKLGEVAPMIAEALSNCAEGRQWADRLKSLEKAWSWARAKDWLNGFLEADAESLERHSLRLDDDIRRNVAELAAVKAWDFCFSRMEESHRRHLMGWQQAMKKLGKGTGKHAYTHRRNAHLSEDGLELTHCTKKGGQVPFGLSPNNPKGGHPYDHPGKARKR